jgi:hypothetical protein
LRLEGLGNARLLVALQLRQRAVAMRLLVGQRTCASEPIDSQRSGDGQAHGVQRLKSQRQQRTGRRDGGTSTQYIVNLFVQNA